MLSPARPSATARAYTSRWNSSPFGIVEDPV